MPVLKSQAAIALCDEIRQLYVINPRTGWIACPHHTRRHIQIGHRDYGTDPDVTVQVDALAHALERLGLVEPTGYTLAIISRS
jgi:hypothetical protein